MTTPIKTLSLALLLATGCSAKLQVAVHAYDGPRPIPHTYAIAYANQVLERPPNAALLQEFAATAASDLNRALELKRRRGDHVRRHRPDHRRRQRRIDGPRTADGSSHGKNPRGGDAKGNGRAKKPTRGPATHRTRGGGRTGAGDRRAPLPERTARTSPASAARAVASTRRAPRSSRTCAGRSGRRTASCSAACGTSAASCPSVRAARGAPTVGARTGQDAKIEQELEQSLQAHYRRLRSTGIAANGADEGRVVGTPLFDPMISVLARAPQPVRRTTRAAWVGRMREWVPISHARFNAKGGNAQFVVVREGLLVFRQKSLDFDPTPVVGAGTATAKLGLSVASALMSSYGIPVGGGKGGSESDGATGVSEEDIAADPPLTPGERAFLRRAAAARAPPRPPGGLAKPVADGAVLQPRPEGQGRVPDPRRRAVHRLSPQRAGGQSQVLGVRARPGRARHPVLVAPALAIRHRRGPAASRQSARPAAEPDRHRRQLFDHAARPGVRARRHSPRPDRHRRALRPDPRALDRAIGEGLRHPRRRPAGVGPRR
jgi:hypothetical protein